jgi:hypothetical protein
MFTFCRSPSGPHRSLLARWERSDRDCQHDMPASFAEHRRPINNGEYQLRTVVAEGSTLPLRVAGSFPPKVNRSKSGSDPDGAGYDCEPQGCRDATSCATRSTAAPRPSAVLRTNSGGDGADGGGDDDDVDRNPHHGPDRCNTGRLRRWGQCGARHDLVPKRHGTPCPSRR